MTSEQHREKIIAEWERKFPLEKFSTDRAMAESAVFLAYALHVMYEAGKQEGHVTLESKEIYRNSFVAGIQRALAVIDEYNLGGQLNGLKEEIERL